MLDLEAEYQQLLNFADETDSDKDCERAANRAGRLASTAFRTRAKTLAGLCAKFMIFSSGVGDPTTTRRNSIIRDFKSLIPEPHGSEPPFLQSEPQEAAERDEAVLLPFLGQEWDDCRKAADRDADDMVACKYWCDRMGVAESAIAATPAENFNDLSVKFSLLIYNCEQWAWPSEDETESPTRQLVESITRDLDRLSEVEGRRS